jgi:transcriptional regulator with XRE-family HTH domain
MRRHDTVETFRSRLLEVIEHSGMSRSEFARRIGADRSTLSQLLAPDGTRLPRAETIAAIAGVAKVSVDWLLGLSAEGQMVTDVLNEAVAIEPGAASPADERLQRWHAEAAGYKIRYVPTTLPDLLKSEAVIRYEYVQHDTLEPQGRIDYAEARLAYSRRPETDIEVCSSYQSIAQFARGEGEWRDLPLEVRRKQLESMMRLLDELYPTFRWFLFDLRQCYSVPFTIFGPQRVAIYVGDMYLVSTSQEHVRVFTGHFDNLIRAATMQPVEVIAYLQQLHDEITSGGHPQQAAPMSA